MVAIAIFSVDPVLRGSLEQLPREDPAITVVGIVDSPPRCSNWRKRMTSTSVVGRGPGGRTTGRLASSTPAPAWMYFWRSADEQKSLRGARRRWHRPFCLDPQIRRKLSL